MAEEGPTPNGFDPDWLGPINNALHDRGVEVVLTDLEPWMWDEFIGPMLDRIEDEPPKAEIDRVACSNCHQQTPATTAHLHQGAWIGEEC